MERTLKKLSEWELCREFEAAHTADETMTDLVKRLGMPYQEVYKVYRRLIADGVNIKPLMGQRNNRVTKRVKDLNRMLSQMRAKPETRK